MGWVLVVVALLSLSASCWALKCDPTDCISTRSVSLHPGKSVNYSFVMTEGQAIDKLAVEFTARGDVAANFSAFYVTDGEEASVLANYSSCHKPCVSFPSTWSLTKRQTRKNLRASGFTANSPNLPKAVIVNILDRTVNIEVSFRIGNIEEFTDSCLVTSLSPIRIVFGSFGTFLSFLLIYVTIRAICRAASRRKSQQQQRRNKHATNASNQAKKSDQILEDHDDNGPVEEPEIGARESILEEQEDDHSNLSDEEAQSLIPTAAISSSSRENSDSTGLMRDEKPVDGICCGLFSRPLTSFKPYYLERGKFTWPFYPAKDEILEKSERLFIFFFVSSIGLLVQTVWVTRLRQQELLLHETSGLLGSFITRIGFSNLVSIISSLFVTHGMRIMKHESKCLHVTLYVLIGMFFLYTLSGIIQLLDMAPCPYIFTQIIQPFAASEISHLILEIPMYYALYRFLRAKRSFAGKIKADYAT